MNQEPQRVAPPALLRQGLQAFREVQDGRQIYKVIDNWKGLTYRFEDWQFFVLAVLPECEDFKKLDSIFGDRFGRALAKEDLEDIVSLATENKLFTAEAGSNPLVAEFNKKRGITLDKDRRPEASAAQAPRSGGAGAATQKSEGERPSSDEGAISNTADFTSGEFRKQKKDVEALCRKIGEYYSPGPIAAPANSIEWLNKVLEMPDLCEQTAVRRPDLTLTEEIIKLKDLTEKNRKTRFKDLRTTDQNAIRKLNRLLLEQVFPKEAPKNDTVVEAAQVEHGWIIFNPAGLLKYLYPVFSPLKYGVYALPVLMIAAIATCKNHADLMRVDMARFYVGIQYVYLTYLAHTMIGMVTDNMLALLATGLTAYAFRATVNAFYLEFHFGFFPRFHVLVGNEEQLSRRERIWLHAAPLLARLVFVSFCLLLWYLTRWMDNFVPALLLSVSVIVIASLFIAGDPLINSSAYKLMAALLNEPELRAKAFMALVNKFRGNAYRKVDSQLLVTYSLASVVAMLATFGVFLWMLAIYLNFQLGGTGVFLVVVILCYMTYRVTKNVKLIGQSYDRIVQFDRWKNRNLPQVEEDAIAGSKPSFKTYAKWAVFILIIVGLLAPYHYEPGGQFVILPDRKAELTSVNMNLIVKVNYDGGEFVNKGAEVAKLYTSDFEDKLKMAEAKVLEQQATVLDLKTRPKPEEVREAEEEVKVEKTRLVFDRDKLERYKKLYAENSISLEELEKQRKEYEVDVSKVREREAHLALVKSGVTQEHIASEEDKLLDYQEEVNYYKLKIAESTIYMPFDGRLDGVHLKQRVGHYMKEGDVFTTAENTRWVCAQVQVPESVIPYIGPSAETRVRPDTNGSTEFTGRVTEIDTATDDRTSGKIVKVLAVVDNKDQRLKSGITGYAKISGVTMPAWKVLSLAIIRFFYVDVWSWIP